MNIIAFELGSKVAQQSLAWVNAYFRNQPHRYGADHPRGSGDAVGLVVIVQWPLPDRIAENRADNQASPDCHQKNYVPAFRWQ